jgi:hypothetical protein
MNCPIYCDADFSARPEAIDGGRGRALSAQVNLPDDVARGQPGNRPLPTTNGMILFARIIEKSDGNQPAVAATCLVFPNRKTTAPAAKANFRAAAQ